MPIPIFPALTRAKHIGVAIRVAVNTTLCDIDIDRIGRRVITNGELRSPYTADHTARLNLESGVGRG